MKRNELMTKSLNITLKKRIVKTLMQSVALYGAETWTLRKYKRKRLDAMEMWKFRRMETIAWTDRKANVEVLESIYSTSSFVEKISSSST